MLRQALSGIARMSTRRADGVWEGRFGKGRIIQMLVGSKSKEIVDAGLDQLSTYGLLKHIGTHGLHPLFAEMERQGFDIPLLIGGAMAYTFFLAQGKQVSHARIAETIRVGIEEGGNRAGIGEPDLDHPASAVGIAVDHRRIGIDGAVAGRVGTPLPPRAVEDEIGAVVWIVRRRPASSSRSSSSR